MRAVRPRWLRRIAVLAGLLPAALVPGVSPVSAQTIPGEVAENFELVGHEPLLNRGMNAALAVHGDFAYVGSRTDGKPGDQNLNNAGILVVDVSDPSNPTVENEIGPPHQGIEGQTSREMRVWPEAELLIVQNLGSNCSPFIHACSPLSVDDNFTFYDISGENAANPQFVGEYFPSSNPHEFFLWDDPFVPGRALLFISAPGPRRVIVADISKAREGIVEEIGSFPTRIPQGGFHSLGISNDGMRAYYAHLTGGFAVADTSDLVNGVEDPEVRLVSQQRVRWPGPGAHSAVKVPGRDVALVTDEVYGEFTDALTLFGGHGCPWGWTRLIDIGQPTVPSVLSEYRLPQNQDSFCETDPPRPFTSISSHNPTLTSDLAFITWHSGGLQAVSLEDPANPTQAGQFLPAPLATVLQEDPALSAGQDKVVMWSFAIVKDGLIYVVDLRNGLYVLRYTGEGAGDVAAIEFLEGNSNLGDALRFEPPDPCERDPVPPGFEEQCAATP